MSNETKEPWLNHLALTTVVLAVCATLSTYKGSSFSTRAVLSQSQSANQWAYYQSKSLKGYLYEIQKEELEAEIDAHATEWSPHASQALRRMAGQYAERVARYDAEKAQISLEARALESRRDHAQSHSQTFGVAVIFFQIAILLSSIAALLKRRGIWMLGCGLGAAGIVFFARGWLP